MSDRSWSAIFCVIICCEHLQMSMTNDPWNRTDVFQCCVACKNKNCSVYPRLYSHNAELRSFDSDVLHHVKYFCHNSKTICQRAAKVYLFGKVFALVFQEHQNHFNRYYKPKVRDSKVRDLSRHIHLCSPIFWRNCFKFGVGGGGGGGDWFSFHLRKHSQPCFFNWNRSSDALCHGFRVKFLLSRIAASDSRYDGKSAFVRGVEFDYGALLSNSCKTRRNTAKDEQKYQPIFLLVFSGSRVTKSQVY